MRWAVRAPTWSELELLRDRVKDCLEAAGKATSCKVDINLGIGYKDCRENDALGTLLRHPRGLRNLTCSPLVAEEYVRIVKNWQGRPADVSNDTLQASTDLVSFAVES